MRLPFGIAVGWFPFLTFLLAVVVLGGLQLIIGHTRMGRSFRVVSDDQETASLMGIRTRHVFGLAMALALVVTAIGGWFSESEPVRPGVGPRSTHICL